MISKIKNTAKIASFCLQSATEKIDLINKIKCMSPALTVKECQDLQKKHIIELLEIYQEKLNDFRNH